MVYFKVQFTGDTGKPRNGRVKAACFLFESRTEYRPDANDAGYCLRQSDRLLLLVT